MKIQCFMPVFSEADILPCTLRHLHEQGCAVHVIDGWSTDGSYEIAQNAGVFSDLWRTFGTDNLITVERFPVGAPDAFNRHAQILERIEHLAEDSDADWCLYSDADEWRRAPLPRATLAEAVAAVDEAGYSAIDFRVFQFYCLDGGWTDGIAGPSEQRPDPEDFFRYYDEADCISRIPNRKLWKNVGRVHLGGGGHEVTFPGMRIYPQKFVMKHYPFRTPAQAKARNAERRARRVPEEVAKGWGTHLDQWPADFDFCWDPAKLKFWKDTRSPLP